MSFQNVCSNQESYNLGSWKGLETSYLNPSYYKWGVEAAPTEARLYLETLL